MKLLVTARSFRLRDGEHKRILREAGYDCVESGLDRPLTAEEMTPLVADVDGIIVGLDEIDARVIAAGARLRVISKFGVGLDNIDLAAAARAGVVVTYTPSANRISVAELTLGLMLCLARRIPQHNALAKVGDWSRFVGVELAGKTLGIVGMGQIGEAVGRRCRALEMQIAYFDRRRRGDLEAEGWTTYSSFTDLLTRSDVVTLHCPYQRGVPPLLDEPELRAMKRTAYLINTARGELVSESALLRALTEGWIAGAASDVFGREPPENSPLLGVGNFLATPHIGAATLEAVERMGIMAARNAVLVLQGRPPLASPSPEEFGNRDASRRDSRFDRS